MWRPPLWAMLLFLGSGCAGGGAKVKAAEPAPAAGDAEDRDASSESVGGGSKAEAPEQKGPPADVLYSAHEAVPAVGASCQSAPQLPHQVSCSEARAKLAEALAQEGQQRDEALAQLELCSDFPAGILRALRAELGPAECADALVEGAVGDGVNSTAIPSDIRETLVALGLGARLRRLAVEAPKAPRSRKKEALEEYFKQELFPWVAAQAQAIFVMASQGTHLLGYARGVVAIEAGNADMRFVEIVREAPIAEVFSKDEEARDLYYATLDERLEPRKTRGRNACLVGLRQMARAGLRTSERVASARQLLSRAYGGRRINALDALFVADIPAQKAESDAAAIASRVPTPYATLLVGRAETSVNLVRAHLQMGMTRAMRHQVESSGDLSARLLLARALFESGRSYFRAEDFQAAYALLVGILDDQTARTELSSEELDEARLVKALSVALVAGPKNSAEMIAKGPRFADALGNLTLLDSLSSEKGELGGRAAFNASYLRELVAPSGAPDYWKDLAMRYLDASRNLKGRERRIARDRSKACQEIERTLRKGAKKK